MSGGGLNPANNLHDLLGAPTKYPDTYFIPEPGIGEVQVVHLDATLEKDAGGGNAGVLGSNAGTLLTGNGAAGGSGLMHKYNMNVDGSPDAVHIQSLYSATQLADAKGVGYAPGGYIAHKLSDYLSHDLSGHSTVHPSGAGVWFDTLDDAVYAMKMYIEEQLLIIKNLPDLELQKLIELAESGHAASCAQILKENYMLGKHKINIFERFDPGPMGHLAFAQTLPSYGTETGYGRMADYLERVATDDLYGDAIKASLRQGRNAVALSELGMNTEIFNLPHSTYYHDPAEMYRQAYTGSLPLVPTFQSDPLEPLDPWIEERNRILIEYGYDPSTMLPAQADETYMDIKANMLHDSVKQQLGFEVCREAVNRNMKIMGKDINIIGLNGNLYKVGSVEAVGLMIDDPQLLAETLLGIVNRLLYGHIGNTKYENPYNTDQMIYGIIELLGQVSPANLEALRNTMLGLYVLPELLKNIKTIINKITGVIDTAMDRNDPNVWGDAGPDSLIKVYK